MEFTPFLSKSIILKKGVEKKGVFGMGEI